MSGENWLLIVVFVVAALVLLALGILLWVWRRRRQPAEEQPTIDYTDVESLPDHGPHRDSRQLTCYGVAVRVAVIVVAPSGRGSNIPAEVVLRDVLDAAVPGLPDVVKDHAPRVDRWPPQLSAQGFMQAFFSHLRLPDDHGKGTVWCGIAGRVEHQGQHFLLGMVCCADRPNSLGEITVEHAGRWLDVLRIRD